MFNTQAACHVFNTNYGGFKFRISIVLQIVNEGDEVKHETYSLCIVFSWVYVKKGCANNHIFFYLRFTQFPNFFGIEAVGEVLVPESSASLVKMFPRMFSGAKVWWGENRGDMMALYWALSGANMSHQTTSTTVSSTNGWKIHCLLTKNSLQPKVQVVIKV